MTPDAALALEYRRDPFAEPSPALRELLDLLRDEPPDERLVLIETVPDRLWWLAQMTGVRGKAPRLLPARPLTSRADGARAIFVRRWERRFGPLPTR